ncbi:MAG: LptF/LptG family permease [Planctomycetota bacterium]|jgi:lipopolysaccharide export LptBFGC system permease protein LptF|nr:LptF/LptG family permease [Planctomycetota bacterium]
MQAPKFKSWLSVWMPFGLRRIDWYFCKFYIRTFILILVALGALVAIGDIFQRFDDFVFLSRRENHDFATGIITFLKYYANWIPQLILQYMLPISLLIAASITVTASYAGPRGNNEYIVIRSSGIPVLRAFFPLIFPAFIIALAFQGTRDFYLPKMVRDSNVIFNLLKSRVSNPTSVTHYGRHGIQTAAIGWFGPGGVAHNVILEVRDPIIFQRGNPDMGDNDFTAFRAAVARLEAAPGGIYQWTPLEKGEIQSYTRYSRRSRPWTVPVPTEMTPAMIERQTLGDSVSSWNDLVLMQKDNPGARFELFWRLAEPVACCLLIILGTGVCMGRMLRGRPANYIQSIAVSMFAAALFYILRLAGKTLWENGTLEPQQGVWLPIAVAFIVAVPVAMWMER